jgi:hypothetical protein
MFTTSDNICEEESYVEKQNVAAHVSRPLGQNHAS